MSAQDTDLHTEENQPANKPIGERSGEEQLASHSPSRDHDEDDEPCLKCEELDDTESNPLLKCDANGEGIDECPNVTHLLCSGFNREPAWYFCDKCGEETYNAHVFFRKQYDHHVAEHTLTSWVTDMSTKLELAETTVRDWTRFDAGKQYKPNVRKGSLTTNRKFLAFYRMTHE